MIPNMLATLGRLTSMYRQALLKNLYATASFRRLLPDKYLLSMKWPTWVQDKLERPHSVKEFCKIAILLGQLDKSGASRRQLVGPNLEVLLSSIVDGVLLVRLHGY